MTSEMASHRSLLLSERGAILGLVTVMALACAIASYTVLMMAGSDVRQGGFYEGRTESRYAAEAGLIWAMQQLWVDPYWQSAAGTTDVTVDVNGRPVNVDIIMPSCGVVAPTPCPSRSLQAKVVY